MNPQFSAVYKAVADHFSGLYESAGAIRFSQNGDKVWWDTKAFTTAGLFHVHGDLLLQVVDGDIEFKAVVNYAVEASNAG